MIDRPGNRICCLTWQPDREPDPVALDAAFRGWHRRQGPGWLLASERTDCASDHARGSIATGTPRLFNRDRARLVGAADLIDESFPAALGRLACPSVVAWQDDAGLCLATDALGIGQVFWLREDGISAASTSATLVADLFRLPLDREALTGFALTGSFIADHSPFQGAAKLMAGHTCRLSGGTIAVERWALPASPGTSATFDDVADAFRAAVKVMVETCPHSDIELSGGLDSRLILAAVPPSLRQGLRSLTIGAPGNEDVRIARRIAQASAMENVRVDPTDLRDTPGPALASLLAQAADGYDHAANPVDKLPLILAGTKLRSSVRFGGQNGEILRGYYYFGQPIAEQPSEKLARNLIRWRLRVNDQVGLDLLAAEDFARREAAVESALIARLVEMGGTWGDALDRFYLAERMQRWVGGSVNNLFVDRTNFYPFFDADFLAAAMALPPDQKRGDALARRLLASLDRDLARIPLDGGRGAAVADNRWLAALARGAHRAVKAGHRIRRQIAKRSRGTLGSGGIIDRWRDEALHRTLPLNALAETGLFAPRMLEKIGDGAWAPDRASLGFVLLLSSLAERSRCAALR